MREGTVTQHMGKMPIRADAEWCRAIQRREFEFYEMIMGGNQL